MKNKCKRCCLSFPFLDFDFLHSRRRLDNIVHFSFCFERGQRSKFVPSRCRIFILTRIISILVRIETTKIVLSSHRTWREFLSDKQFYLTCSIWMLTRVISNISQVYLPLYIIDATDAEQIDRVKKSRISFSVKFE